MANWLRLLLMLFYATLRGMREYVTGRFGADSVYSADFPISLFTRNAVASW